MERDYPEGHPAASDYSGEQYTPPRAPHSEDFPPDHPARGGKNVSALDSPDGKHAQTVQESKDSAARTQRSEPREAERESSQQQPAADAQTTTITITGRVENT